MFLETILISFGTKIVRETGFMPTFKVPRQVYHLIGSLQSRPNEEPNFLQLYFVGDLHRKAEQWHNSHLSLRRELILRLQEMIHKTSNVRSLKYSLEITQNINFKDFINIDQRREYQHQFNALEINEIRIRQNRVVKELK